MLNCHCSSDIKASRMLKHLDYPHLLIHGNGVGIIIQSQYSFCSILIRLTPWLYRVIGCYRRTWTYVRTRFIESMQLLRPSKSILVLQWIISGTTYVSHRYLANLHIQITYTNMLSIRTVHMVTLVVSVQFHLRFNTKSTKNATSRSYFLCDWHSHPFLSCMKWPYRYMNYFVTFIDALAKIAQLFEFRMFYDLSNKILPPIDKFLLPTRFHDAGNATRFFI